MKKNKEALRTAKRIFSLVKLPQGGVNADYVRKVIQKLKTQQPRGYQDIMKSLAKMIAHDIYQRTIVVTSFETLSSEEKNVIEYKYRQQFKEQKILFQYRQDHSLIGGVTIRKGDTITDFSIKGKLNHIKQTFNQ